MCETLNKTNGNSIEVESMTSKLAEMEVECIAVTPDAEKLIELAGRTAYKSFDKITDESAGEFIRRIIKNGHESVLEHAVASFRIKGISRACSHQLVRHRLASYTQSSQRFVDETGATYVVPPSIQNNEKVRALYWNYLHNVEAMYNLLKQVGIPNEDARFVLPNATATEIVMTANFREWRHFFLTRGDPHAQWEIRALACAIFRQFQEFAPSVVDDLCIYEHRSAGLIIDRVVSGETCAQTHILSE